MEEEDLATKYAIKTDGFDFLEINPEGTQISGQAGPPAVCLPAEY